MQIFQNFKIIPPLLNEDKCEVINFPSQRQSIFSFWDFVSWRQFQVFRFVCGKKRHFTGFSNRLTVLKLHKHTYAHREITLMSCCGLAGAECRLFDSLLMRAWKKGCNYFLFFISCLYPLVIFAVCWCWLRLFVFASLKINLTSFGFRKEKLLFNHFWNVFLIKKSFVGASPNAPPYFAEEKIKIWEKWYLAKHYSQRLH